MASLDRTIACRRLALCTDVSLDRRDGVVWLSITAGGQQLSARIAPGVAINLGADLLDLGFMLAPEFRAEGH
jgi:hypothetical protein